MHTCGHNWCYLSIWLEAIRQHGNNIATHLVIYITCIPYRSDMCGDGILRTMIVPRLVQGAVLEHSLASHLIKAQHLVSYGLVVKKLSLSAQGKDGI